MCACLFSAGGFLVARVVSPSPMLATEMTDVPRRRDKLNLGDAVV